MGFSPGYWDIDGSHIPILKPTESLSDYFCRKGFYSIILQGVVDSRDLFIDDGPEKFMMHRYLLIQHFIVNAILVHFSQIGKKP